MGWLWWWSGQLVWWRHLLRCRRLGTGRLGHATWVHLWACRAITSCFGPGCLEESEVAGVLVMQASGHPAAEFQPVLLELPHGCLPGAGCWSGVAPRPPRATGVSGPSRPRRSQGRAEGPASTHERAAALDSGARKGWEPVQQANGRAVRGRGAVGVPAWQRRRRVEVVRRPARTRATALGWPAGRPARETCRRCRRSELQGVQDVQSDWVGGVGAGAGVGGVAAGPAAGQPASLSHGRVSHGAPVPGGRPGSGTAGSEVGAASVASGQRRAGGPGRRWGPSRVAHAGRPG